MISWYNVGTTQRRRAHDTRTGTEKIFWLRFLPSRPAGDHLRSDERARRPGDPADRRRQIAVLPDPCDLHAGADARDLAAHLADEGSRGRARGNGRGSALAVQRHDNRAFRRNDASGARRRAGSALCRARAAGARRLSGNPRQPARDNGRRGRSALREPVGPRFSPQLHAHRRASRGFCRAPRLRRLHRDSHRPGARGHHRPAASARSLLLHLQL